MPYFRTVDNDTVVTMPFANSEGSCYRLCTAYPMQEIVCITYSNRSKYLWGTVLQLTKDYRLFVQPLEAPTTNNTDDVCLFCGTLMSTKTITKLAQRRVATSSFFVTHP